MSKAEYRNITVEFLDPRVTNYGYQGGSDGQSPNYGSTAMGPPPDEQTGFVHVLPLHSVSVRDVRLRPGEQLAPPEMPAKELMVAVTELDLRSSSESELTKQSGEIAWFQAASGWINRGSKPARFVVVEFL